MEQINKYIEHIKSLDGTELEEIIEFNVFEFLGSKSENNINTLIFSRIYKELLGNPGIYEEFGFDARTNYDLTKEEENRMFVLAYRLAEEETHI